MCYGTNYDFAQDAGKGIGKRMAYPWGTYAASRRPDAKVDDRKTLAAVQREEAIVREKLACPMAHTFQALPILNTGSSEAVAIRDKLARSMTGGASGITGPSGTSGRIGNDGSTDSATDSDSDAYDEVEGSATLRSRSDAATNHYLDQLVGGVDISFRRSADEFNALTRP